MSDASKTDISGPSWDLTSEYLSPQDPELQADLDRCQALLDDIGEFNVGLAGDAPVESAQRIYKLAEEAETLLDNAYTYANCLLSVNSRDDDARELLGSLQNYRKRMGEQLEPLSQFIDLADDAVVARYLSDPQVAPSEFLVNHSRARRHELLSLDEENLVHGLAQDGIHAWGNLYDQLSGTISCDVLVGNETQALGLAEASGLLMKQEVQTRQNAWRAINDGWQHHEESCAAAINAIAGWRLEMCKKRSRTQPVHFLDAPVHDNRIDRATLDTLLSVAQSARPLAQRAAKLQARAYGLDAIGPWDNRAPAPSLGGVARGRSFAEAVELIASAYAEVSAEMGDFVHMMVDNGWVEGTVGGNKRPGAYCTRFAKSKTPRVYMTYTGGDSDVITLAHELGHAFHGWVMRDLPESQTSYGMSLAETASTFGETLVRDALLHRAETPEQKLNIAWEELSALVAFILNIPTRFVFERRFYEARQARPLRAQELKDLMSDAWREWYGDALSEPDPLFWANKLHFYISGLSFYNFPYLFGYLFSLGVYAKRDAFGAEFYPRYVALLRDTGRMSAEDLAAKHLHVDIRKPRFWEETVATLQPRVEAFESLLNQLGL